MIDFDLATLDEQTGQPPESRIRSATAVRNRVAELRRAEGVRAQRRAKVQGLLDGNQPYSPKRMRDTGRGNDSNINLRTGEGTVDAAKTPYYDLIFEVPRFANIELEYGTDPQKNFEWSETVSNGFHNLLDRWDGFDFNTQLEQWQMCVHGIGIPMWEDRTDWRWKARKIGDVLVPDDAEADIDELEECAIPRRYLPTALYRLIKNEAAAKLNKLNVEAIQKAIIAAAPAALKTQYGNEWEGYQESLRCGDISWGNKSNRIYVVDYFLKEFDGTITRTMILDEGSAGVVSSTGDTASADEGFLFRKEKYADCFAQIICPFFFDIGTGLWHSIKGLGPKVYDYCELENRLTGRMIDEAMAGTIVTAESADILQKMQLVPHGPLTVAGPGLTFPNLRLGENLNAKLATKRDLQNTLQSNTGQYRQRVSDDNHEPTLGQAQMNAQQQATLGHGAVNRRYRIQDRLYREMLRRALNPKLKKDDPGGKEALEFRDWCMEQGVPKEALVFEKVCRVKAVRSIGYGSPAMRELVSNKLFSLLPQMNERSRTNALRTIVAPYVGQAQVDAYFPPASDAGIPDDHAALATLENNALRQADGEVIVTPTQEHVTHFQIHFADVAEHFQQLRAGQAHPVEVLTHAHQAGPHMRQHLNAIQNDPTRKDQLAPMEAAWQTLSKMTDQLQQQTMQAMKAQQAQQQQDAPPPQPDPQAMAALAKAHGDLQIKAFKAQGDLQLKKQKQDAMLQLKDAQTAHDMRAKTAAAMQPPIVAAEPQGAVA